MSLRDLGGELVYVVGLGASTPVGRDAWSSGAAVRAGISAFADHPYMVDTAGEPMRVAQAPWLDIGIEGQSRCEALLFPAIEQALLPIDAAPPARTRVALVLGLPSARPGCRRSRMSLRARIASSARIDSAPRVVRGRTCCGDVACAPRWRKWRRRVEGASSPGWTRTWRRNAGMARTDEQIHSAAG